MQFCRALFSVTMLCTIDLNLKLRLPMPNQLQKLKAEWRVEIQANCWQPCAILVIYVFAQNSKQLYQISSKYCKEIESTYESC